jgi:hypothetical protein
MERPVWGGCLVGLPGPARCDCPRLLNFVVLQARESERDEVRTNVDRGSEPVDALRSADCRDLTVTATSESIDVRGCVQPKLLTIELTWGCLIVLDVASNGEQSVSILPQTGSLAYHTE